MVLSSSARLTERKAGARSMLATVSTGSFPLGNALLGDYWVNCDFNDNNMQFNIVCRGVVFQSTDGFVQYLRIAKRLVPNDCLTTFNCLVGLGA